MLFALEASVIRHAFPREPGNIGNAPEAAQVAMHARKVLATAEAHPHRRRESLALLMMHNDEDGAVPWEQGIEYFVALRRLSKPVWMLNYNGEAHDCARK
jgi:hypothetical protein